MESESTQPGIAPGSQWHFYGRVRAAEVQTKTAPQAITEVAPAVQVQTRAEQIEML